MKKPDSRLHLTVAVGKWVELIFEPGGPFLTEPGPTAARVVSPVGQESLLEIAQSLPAEAPFRDLTELGQFLTDTLVRAFTESESHQRTPDLMTLQIVAAFASPFRAFAFDAPLSFRSQFLLRGPLRGDHSFHFTAEESANAVVLGLSGELHAPTELAAIRQLDEAIEALLGVSAALDLCAVIPTLPGANPQVPFVIRPHDESIPNSLSPDAARAVAGAVFRLPPNGDDVSRRRIEMESDDTLGREIRCMAAILCSQDERSVELRNAARLFLRAICAPDLGATISTAFMCLEAILLEAGTTDTVQARLTEAVAYRIGTSGAHRARLRKEIKELYNLRSRYVHQGHLADGLRRVQTRETVLSIAEQVLAKELMEAVS